MNVPIKLSRFFGRCSFLRKSLTSLETTNITNISLRTNFILRRRREVPLYPKEFDVNNVAGKLDPIYYEYEVVNSPEDTKDESIEVLLTEFIEDVGKKGQIVTVDSSLGYNDFILTGRAVYATPENIAKMKIISEQDIDQHSSLSAYKTMKLLRNKVLTVYMNMHNPWTIERRHIRITLRLNGIHVLNDSCIQLPEKAIIGPNLDLEGKDFVSVITINNCEQVPLRCRLRHWTISYSEKIALPPNHDRIPSEPIFAEQAELLASIPLPKPEEAEVL